MIKNVRELSYDLVNFTTRVPDTSHTSASRVRYKQHECDASEKF